MTLDTIKIGECYWFTCGNHLVKGEVTYVYQGSFGAPKVDMKAYDKPQEKYWIRPEKLFVLPFEALEDAVQDMDRKIDDTRIKYEKSVARFQKQRTKWQEMLDKI